MTKRTILANTTSLALSRVFCKVLLVAFHLLLARYLGAGGFGRFAFAFALSGCLFVLADLGLSPTALRDLSKNPESLGPLLKHALVIKGLLGVAVLAVAVAMNRIIGLEGPVATTVLLFGGGMILLSQTQTLQYGILSREDSRLVALSFLFQTGLYCALGAIMMAGRLGVEAFALAYLVSNGLNLVLVLVLFLSNVARGALFLRSAFSLTYAWELVRKAFPIAAAAAFVMVYFRIATVFVRLFAGEEAAGHYSIAYGMLEGFLFLSASYRLALFPVLSRFMKGSAESLSEIMERSVKVQIALTFGICLIVYFSAGHVIAAALGSGYLGSVPVLRVLIWALPLCFLNDLFNTFMISSERQAYAARAAGLAAGLNVAANALLVPHMGAMGAAWACVITEATLFLLLSVRASGALPGMKVCRQFQGPVLSLAFALAAAALIPESTPLLRVPVVALLYGTVLITARTFTTNDRRVFLTVLGERRGRGFSPAGKAP